MASLFKRGFKAVNEEKERQEEARENMKKGLWRFFLKKDKEEADISFLTEDPVNFYEHSIKTSRNGKEFYDNIPCTGSDCPHCDNGSRPTFKSAWLVVDHREYEYTDKDNKKQKGKDQIRLFVYGTKVAGQLDRKSNRYGLVGTVYTMIRIGKGTDTTYTFENGDKFKYTAKEIEQLLPEALREEYDGTENSLCTLIENQILMLTSENGSNNDEEDTSESVRNKVVSVDDEEEVKSPSPRKSVKKLHKKENSVKHSVKSILKKKKEEDDLPF